MNAGRSSRLGLKGNRGSALLAVMCFATVLVLALTTFQALCNQTLKTSNRNAQSTHAIELAEMGMETAVWSRTNAKWTTAAGGIGDWTISSGTASITLSGSNYNFSNGATGSVAISVTYYIVTSPASVATVTATITLADGSTVARQLKATLKKTEPIANALAGVLTYNGSTAYGGTVTINSGGSKIDSYSSRSNPTAAPTNTDTDYGALVMATTSVTMSNNATINGYIATNPNSAGSVALTYTTGSSGSKLKGLSTSSTLNIDTTRQTTSPYQNVFDVTAPTEDYVVSNPTGTTVNWGTANTTTVYRISTSSPDISSATINIAANSDVSIVANGTLWIDTSCTVNIASGASLKIFVSGGFYIYQGSIINADKLPKNLAIIGTATSTGGLGGYIYSPNKFYGTVYLPRVSFVLYGNNPTSEFFGSFVASDLTVYPLSSTNLKVHYDKDLASETLVPDAFPNVTRPYSIQSGTLKEYDVATGAEL